MKRVLFYFHTLKYLRRQQIYFRILNFFKKQFSLNRCLPLNFQKQASTLQLRPSIFHKQIIQGKQFSFLNLPKVFEGPPEWDFGGHGKLWCYNLNYFNYLNQEGLSAEEGLALIYNFVAGLQKAKTGLEPYPTSLRTINWIKFFSRHNITVKKINNSLYAQVHMLSKNLEYHLLGNHLLENAFALLFAGYYFEDAGFYEKAKEILKKELGEQILPDGGHFELTPMYHQILLERMLDSINLVKHNNQFQNELLDLLTQKSSIMLGWLSRMTFSNGDMPLVNDAANGIAPSAAELFGYGTRLGIAARKGSLKESGYRKIEKQRYEIIVDVGNIGPDYIPGHAHSDTFNFVLYIDGKPFITDTGTSTYEAGELRLAQRSTAAHNTVRIDGLEQSEVWGSFRVARRAYVTDLTEEGPGITAAHTGYTRIGAVHRRTFEFTEGAIDISDEIISSKAQECSAFFHFHPDIVVDKKKEDTVFAGGKRLFFSGASDVRLTDYLYAPEFNMLMKATMAEVRFTNRLDTKIVP